MSAGQTIKVAEKLAKPLLSTSHAEARRRVLNLYKAWYRQIPFIVKEYHINKDEDQLKAKLRENFYKNKNVSDIRVIDVLVIKGQMELKETTSLFKQPCHLMMYFKDTIEPKPADFLSKFLNGTP